MLILKVELPFLEAISTNKIKLKFTRHACFKTKPAISLFLQLSSCLLQNVGMLFP